MALGCTLVPKPVGVEKEEKEGMEMDFAARAEEKRDSTEEMMEETNLSLAGMVPLVLAKEGVGAGEAEEEEDSVNEAEEVEEDSIDELEEEDDDDEESAEELELETKELVGVAEELDEAELLWTVDEELTMLEDELEEMIELLEEGVAEEEDLVVDELDDTAEEEEALLAFEDEDEEGLWAVT